MILSSEPDPLITETDLDEPNLIYTSIGVIRLLRLLESKSEKVLLNVSTINYSLDEDRPGRTEIKEVLVANPGNNVSSCSWAKIQLQFIWINRWECDCYSRGIANWHGILENEFCFHCHFSLSLWHHANIINLTNWGESIAEGFLSFL